MHEIGVFRGIHRDIRDRASRNAVWSQRQTNGGAEHHERGDLPLSSRWRAEGGLARLLARVLESESVNSPVVGQVTLTWCCPP